MSAKIPQQSSSRLWLRTAATPYRKSLKNGAPKQEAHAPIFIRAHIPLAGHDLANNHTFKLLSRLLRQTLYIKNITPKVCPVNKKRAIPKGGLAWGFIRSKPDLSPQYYIKKPRQASALPWLFILSCRKISRFGVLCSFEGKIFSHKNIQRTKKYCMYFKDDGFFVGKKILSKPYKSLSEPA